VCCDIHTLKRCLSEAKEIQESERSVRAAVVANATEPSLDRRVAVIPKRNELEQERRRRRSTALLLLLLLVPHCADEAVCQR
jgi:hypothetical protein